MKLYCDWCKSNGAGLKEAKFVVTSGNIDAMEVEEYFICMTHAESLCRNRNSVARKIIGGAHIDIFEMQAITDQAKRYYLGRFAELDEQYANGGYIPNSQSQPYSRSVRRERRVYRYQGKIWQHLPVH